MDHGLEDALSEVGLRRFLCDLILVGLFYHTYNQVDIQLLKTWLREIFVSVQL